MPDRSNPLPTPPKYRHYKPKDLAVVRIDGRDRYLGKFGSAESRAKYRRLVADWLARAADPVTPPDSPAAGTLPPAPPGGSPPRPRWPWPS